MSASNVKWVRLGDYITQRREKNDDSTSIILGVTREGFIPPKQEGADTSLYNIFYKGDFVFNPARMELNSICLNLEYDKAICSSLYEIFYINKPNELLPEFLNLYLKREEFARYCWYDAIGSARNYFRVANMLEIKIPLPSIEIQQELVNTYNGLKALAEQNEALIEPLSKACEAFIVDCKTKYPIVELGEYIEECVEKNSKKLFDENYAQGINTNKEFQESKRISEDVSLYKIVKKNYIAFNANIKLTTNTEKFAVALYKNDTPCIISGFYEIMKCKEDFLIPEFLILWVTRDSFAKYVKFMSCSSIRDRFSFRDMQDVKIPLPPIDVQQSIVNLYNCLEEAKKIASQARERLKTLCPALVQRAIHS